MLRKLFSTMMCTALLVQSTSVLHAEQSEINSSKDDEVIYPADEVSDFREVELEVEPEENEINELIIDDEASDAYGIDVEYHSIGVVRNYFNANKVNYLNSAYEITPSVTAPYSAGSLTDTTLSDALKAVNLIRYIAGLNYNVTSYTDYNELVQAGALLNAVNNSLSQPPAKPAGMDDSLYQDAVNGNRNSILASGYSSLAEAITGYWLNDPAFDSSGKPTLKYRRLLLNLGMGKTGFGQVGSYSGMYTSDTTGSCTRNSTVWPAQSTPLEFFGGDDYWCVTTGSNDEDLSDVQIKMTNNITKQEYIFSENSAPGYIGIDNSSYGETGALIWRPNGLTYADGDSYEVEITGLSLGDIYYNVTFFQMEITNERVVMNPEYAELEVGKSLSIYYSIDPVTSTDTWDKRTFYDNGVISVDHLYPKRYVITALKPGNSYVRAVTKNGLEGVCSITVKGIAMNPETVELHPGEQKPLIAKIYPENASATYSWVSSNPSVATVNSTGVVTALKDGTATITASSNGYSGTCTVTVSSISVTDIAMSAASLALTPSETKQLTASILPENATNKTVTWSSSNPSIAKVSTNGLVTAVSEGTATITATTANGLTAECQVRVASSWITMAGSTLELNGLIMINFWTLIPDDYNEADIVMTLDGRTVTVVASDAIERKNGSVKYKVFQCPVYSTEMRDTITFTAKLNGVNVPMKSSSGRDLTSGFEYTVAEVLTSYKSNSNTKLANLAKAMDNYGKLAQLQFGHNTEGVALDDESAAEISAVTAAAFEPYVIQKDEEITGIKLMGTTLELKEETIIRMYFGLTGSQKISEYTFEVNDNPATVRKSGSYYLLELKDIKANAIGKMVKVEVSRGSEKQTIHYNALSYALDRMKDAGETEIMKNLCRGLYLYYTASLGYFGEPEN